MISRSWAVNMVSYSVRRLCRAAMACASSRGGGSGAWWVLGSGSICSSGTEPGWVVVLAISGGAEMVEALDLLVGVTLS